MKILLLGKNGQLGQEIYQSLYSLGRFMACGRDEVDLENPRQIRAIVRSYLPHVIINAAAYTDVEMAEDEPAKARQVNERAVETLAIEARNIDAWLIHYSTDYVFDGEKEGAYLETDETRPINIYGKSKLLGEDAILKSNCKHFIFRTSWPYSIYGDNFLKTILGSAKEREELRVVSDQVGTPTSMGLIADVTSLVIQRIKRNYIYLEGGIYHLTPAGQSNWFDFAKFIVESAWKEGVSLKLRPENIIPILSEQYNFKAKRPRNSLLDSSKIRKKFELSIHHWERFAMRELHYLFALEKSSAKTEGEGEEVEEKGETEPKEEIESEKKAEGYNGAREGIKKKRSNLKTQKSRKREKSVGDRGTQTDLDRDGGWEEVEIG